MRTSLAGRTEGGVTLIEMLMVVLIISLMAGVSFPAISSGVDSLRLRGTGEEVAALFTTAVNRAERRRIPVEVAISVGQNLIVLTSTEPGFVRRYQPSGGITIAGVLPPAPVADPTQPRRFLIYPGGTVPRVGVLLSNPRGTRRVVRVDPVTGVAESRTIAVDEALP